MVLSKIYNKLFYQLIILFPIFGYITLNYFGIGLVNSFSIFILFVYLTYSPILLFSSSNIKHPTFLTWYLIFIIYSLIIDTIYGIYNKESLFKQIYSNKGLILYMLLFLIENHFKIRYFNYNSFKLQSYILIAISVIVIFIQQFQPEFLVNPEIITKYYGANQDFRSIESYELRSFSIFSWTTNQGIAFTLIPIIFIISSELIRNKNNMFWFFVVLGILCSFLSKARFIIINSLLLFILFFHRPNLKLYLVIRSLIVLIILFSLSLFYLKKINIPVDSIIYGRLFEESRGGLTSEESSFYSRVVSYNAFINLFPQNMIFGAGDLNVEELEVELKGSAPTIHIGFLKLLYSYGIFGGLLYLFFLFYLLKYFYKNAKTHNYWGGFYSWIGFILSNFTMVLLIPFEMGLILTYIIDQYYLKFTYKI